MHSLVPGDCRKVNNYLRSCPSPWVWSLPANDLTCKQSQALTSVTCNTNSSFIGHVAWSIFHSVQILQLLKMSLMFLNITNDPAAPREYGASSWSSRSGIPSTTYPFQPLSTARNTLGHPIIPPTGAPFLNTISLFLLIMLLLLQKFPLIPNDFSTRLYLRTHHTVLQDYIISFKARLYFSLRREIRSYLVKKQKSKNQHHATNGKSSTNKNQLI